MNNLNEDNILEVDNKDAADMWYALERLKKNADFQKVILKGYFVDKAVDGVSLLAQDAVINSGHRPAVIEDLVGISSLQDHFMVIENLGAPSMIDEDESGE
tara:strand:+ start:590 stop:892 length:303 start_codon:yes stop_codon:yes gene_type:complete